MSDTPLTDKAIFKYGCKHCGPYKEEGVEPAFARQLERELQEAREAIKLLITDVENEDSVISRSKIHFRLKQLLEKGEE